MSAKLLHGIDMSAPDAIEKLLAFHHQSFGDALMQLNEDSDEDDADEEDDQNLEDDSNNDEDNANDDDGEDDDPPGSEALGDPGKKALQAMKQKVRESKKAEREAKAALAAALKGNQSADDEDEDKLEAARAEGFSKAKTLLINTKAESLAAQRFANPELGVQLLDLSEVDVSEEGEIDVEEITDQMDELLQKYPYLAAQRGGNGGQKFDSARGKQRTKSMLTPEQIKSMKPADIAKAYDEGRIKF